MKYVFYLMLVFGLLSCEQAEPPINRLNRLSRPVVLIGKSESNFCSDCWGITVIGSNGNVESFGNALGFANNIGAQWSVGDTIIK
jgi:hypothetical protein